MPSAWLGRWKRPPEALLTGWARNLPTPSVISDELKRSISHPVITFNEDTKQRYHSATADIRETQNHLGQASTYGSQEEEIGAGGVCRSTFAPEGAEEVPGTAMDQELDHQNNRTGRTEEKTVNLDN
ncbi:hypothetical protein EDB86DRAFT_2827541 [Lactarius hatsudake]|nr:hypothetical protein EDB86DRAFT_2827541 [Lactarius hatsudake]